MEEDAHAVYSGVTVIVHHDMAPHNQVGTRLYCIPICVVNRTACLMHSNYYQKYNSSVFAYKLTTNYSMKHICWLNWNLTKAPLPSKYNYQSHVNSICESPAPPMWALSSPLTVHFLLTCGCISCAHDWLLLESFNTVFAHSCCGNSN